MDENPELKIQVLLRDKQVDLVSAETDAQGKTVHRECHEYLCAVSLEDSARYV